MLVDLVVDVGKRLVRRRRGLRRKDGALCLRQRGRRGDRRHLRGLVRGCLRRAGGLDDDRCADDDRHDRDHRRDGDDRRLGLRDRQDQGNRSRRFVRFLCSGGAGGEALAVLDGRLRRRFVAQCLEVGSDLFGFAPVGGIKGSTRTNARRQLVETGDGACEHGLRGGGQRSTALLQPEKALLERLGRPRHEREPSGAMDTAERVTGTDHRLRRGQRRIGLQRLQLRVQRRQVLLRFVAQDSVERTRECHLPDGDLVGLEARADSGRGSGSLGSLGHRCMHRAEFNDFRGRDRHLRGVRHEGRRLVELEYFDRQRTRRVGGLRWYFHDRGWRRIVVRQFHLDLGDRGTQGLRVGRHLAFAPQRIDPNPEARLRAVDHRQHRGRCRPVFLEQPVVNLFDLEGDLAELT